MTKFQYYKDQRYGIWILKPMRGESAEVFEMLTHRKECTEKDIECLARLGVECEMVINPAYAL